MIEEENKMTVKQFIQLHKGIDIVKVELFELNENVIWDTDTEILARADELHEKWKNAEVQDWQFDEDTLYLSVIK